MTIRVVIADDQALLRTSLAMLLDAEPDITVVGQAADGDEAVAVVRRERPDVVLMDIRMPGRDGLDATREICADPELASVRVCVLTMFELDDYVFGALRAGASGFLLKDAEPEVLARTLRAIRAGEPALSPSVTERVVARALTAPGDAGPAAGEGRVGAAGGGGHSSHGDRVDRSLLDVLTPRETEVLTLVGRGRTNAEIEAELYIAKATVKSHIAHLLSKLQARDRAQLVITAWEAGLVQPGDTRAG